MSIGYDASHHLGTKISPPRLVAKLIADSIPKPRPMGPKDLTGVNIKLMVWITAYICANWSQLK